MFMELPKQYNAKDIEEKWYEMWEKNGYFSPQIKEGQTPFTIVIPPPNVTGILHMGHGLNNTLQDILIRQQRMKGVPALWIPGTDHAGIATQNVVEKKLHKAGTTRHDLGKEAFIREVWQWKEEHGSTIIRQLKRLGCSCDWSRERFTMDEGLSRAVREVFVRLYEKGLIYRGYYIVNWCPRCHTALSDEEAEHRDVQGKLYFLRYPIAERVPERLSDTAQAGIDYIVVATTRPETMLGDTAVAIHPQDERYAGLIHKSIMLPLMNRKLKVIQDEFVDMGFGTGVVKVTPAHDPNDFDMGRRHGLTEINVLNPDGTINENGGIYCGMDRFEARKKIIADMQAKNLFIKEEAHAHAVGHCYRCDTVVEPYLSKQWFVKMKPLAKEAITVAEDGRVCFMPERWKKVYLNWMNNIRDWCISRQIWWGHQIPVWYCDECGKISVSRDDISTCIHCSSDTIIRDPDVLDTWFSSWLWPFSTLGWPEKTKELAYYYPTSVLSTAPEILFFWVARMIISGLEFMGDIPFHTVYLHGTVRDETGRKMSKSLGNSIDPLDVIDKVGADALRFIIISLTAQGQDVYLSEQKFLVGRNFTNKIWNAARFSFMNLEGFSRGSLSLDIEHTALSVSDRWILNTVNELVDAIETDLSKYRFNDACNHLYAFIWNDFCDWYLELIKPVFYGDRSVEEKESAQKVIFYVWLIFLRLLHPIMPFITEELWQRLRQFAPSGVLSESIMIAPWPQSDPRLSFPVEAEEISFLQDIVVGIREKRAQHAISPVTELKVTIVAENDQIGQIIKKIEHDILSIGKLERVVLDKTFTPQEGWVPAKLTTTLKHLKVFIFLGDIVDFEKERQRVLKEMERIDGFIARVEGKLKNAAFVSKAPQDVVDKEKKKLCDARAARIKLEESLQEL
jgi:valyl-tRNA synthetase